MPNSPKPKTIFQPADVCKTADLDGKRALLKLSSDTTESVSTPTQIHESVESDTNSDSKKLHFSETLGKYLTNLKSIKCPKINNSELLVGVDRVSRSKEGCIKLTESALGSSKTQQNPEALNPPQERSGDILSGVDRVDSKLIDCINMTETAKQEAEIRGRNLRGIWKDKPLACSDGTVFLQDTSEPFTEVCSHSDS